MSTPRTKACLVIAALSLAGGGPLLGCADVVAEEHAGVTSGAQGTSATTTMGGMGGAGGQGGAGGMGAACPGSWARVLDGPAAQYGDSIAVDSAGAAVLSASFLTQVTLDGVPLQTGPAYPSAGALVVKLDASGALAWSRTVNTSLSGDLGALPIATDAANDVLLGGSFFGMVDLGDGVSAGAPEQAVFVSKLSASGQPRWVRGFPGAFFGTCMAGLAVDAAGDVFFTGVLDGKTIEIGADTLQGGGFVAKLDPSGYPLWARAFDGVLMDSRALAVTPAGHVVLAGSLEGTADFGGGPLTSAGGFDVFVAELDGDGNHVFSERFGDAGVQSAYALALDTSGDIFLAGVDNGTIDFGGGPLSSGNAYNSFVAKLDPTGKHVWSRLLPGDGAEPTALTVAPDGEVVLAGSFYDTFDAGCGPVTAAPSQVLGFVVRLDAAGACVSLQGFGAGQEQYVRAIAADGAGRAAALGYFSGTIDLDGSTKTSDVNDGFVTMLAPSCGP